MHVLMLFPASANGGARSMVETLSKALEARGVGVANAWAGVDSISFTGQASEHLRAKGFLAQSRVLQRWVNTHAIDVIHSHLGTYRLAAWTGWRGHRPSLRTMHGRLDRPGMLAPAERYGTWAGIRLFGQKIVAVSEYVTTDLLATYPLVLERNAFEIVNGINPPDQMPERCNDSGLLRVLYVGRMEEAKGFNHLLEAIVQLRHENVPIHFTAVGDGPLKARIPHDNRIEVTDGWITRDGIHAYLARSDVFVLPSYSEGLSIALLEAMAQGVIPVISEAAAANGIVTEGHNGFVISAGLSDAIATGIRSIAEHPREIDRLRRNAYATIRERFTADRMAADYVNLYTRLLSS